MTGPDGYVVGNILAKYREQQAANSCRNATTTFESVEAFALFLLRICDQVRYQPRRERNQRSRVLPRSLIRYSKVPRPRERLSSKPKPHSLLKYVQADLAGKKSSFSAASLGPSHSPWAEANKARTCSLSSLYRFIFFSESLFLRYQKLVDEIEEMRLGRAISARPKV